MRAVVCLLAAALPAASAGLHVVVRDATNAAVPEAEVTLQCGSRLRRAQAGVTGAADFPDPAAGTCQVKVQANGFAPWQTAYTPIAGKDGELQAVLKVAVQDTKLEVHPKSAPRRFFDWLTSCTRK